MEWLAVNKTTDQSEKPRLSSFLISGLCQLQQKAPACPSVTPGMLLPREQHPWLHRAVLFTAQLQDSCTGTMNRLQQENEDKWLRQGKNLFTECCTQATSPQVAPTICNDIVSSILCWIERDNPVISQSLDSLSALPHARSHTHQARELKQPKHKKKHQLVFKTSLLCHTSSCLHTIGGVRATIQGHTWESYLLHHWTDLPELPPSSWSDLCSCFHCRRRSEGRMGLFAPLHERTAGETNLSFQTWNIQH